MNNASDVLARSLLTMPVGRPVSVPATAGENSLAIAAAGENVLLQIQRIVIANTNAASITAHLHATYLSGIVAAFTLVGRSNFITCARRTADQDSGTASEAYGGTRVAAVGVFGLTIGIVAVPAGGSVVVDFPDDGILLIGREPNPGRGALLVVNQAANSALDVSFFGKQSTLPSNF